MAAGKISELVSDEALAQLDELYKRLGIVRGEMVSATEQAAKFTAALGDSKSIAEFTAAQDKANASMQQAIQVQQTVAATQKEVAVQTQAVTDAIKIKVAADADAEKVLKQVGGSLDANIKFLVQQKLELKQVNDQLKELNGTSASSIQARTALSNKTQELTKKQVELKEAISAQSLVIKQQVKDNNAASGSQDQMLARLNQLRKAYNSLSEEERNNAQVGGVLLGNIKQLATATAAINAEQGKYNDTVGNYEAAIKSAISAYVPYGNQIVKSVDLFQKLTKETGAAGAATAGLGTQFAAFTIGEFAVAIAAATYYLTQFRDTGNKTEQFLTGLKNQFSQFGKNVIDVFSGKRDASLFTGLADSFRQGMDVAKLKQDVQNLNEVNDQLVQKKQAQADQDRALAKNQKLTSDERISYLKKAQAIEKEIVEMQQDNADANINLAIQTSDAIKKLSDGDKKTLANANEGSVRFANDLVKTGRLTEEGYELLMNAYQRQTAAMNSANMKLIRQQTDEAKIELKDAKQINTDRLELVKARLEGEKAAAKAILDDDKQSYEARLAALKIFVARSNALIDTQQQIANVAPKITGVQKQTNAQKAKNEKASVAAFDSSEQLKIQKEAVAEFKRVFEDLQIEVTNDLKESLNQQLIAIEQNNADEIAAVTDKYTKRLISEQQFNQQVKLINDRANEAKIAAELQTQEAILSIQQGLQLTGTLTNLPVTNTNAKDIQGTRDRIGTLKASQTRAQTQTSIDSGKSDVTDAKKAEKDVADAIGYLQSLETDASKIIEAGYQRQIELLQRKSDLINESAKQEIETINGSILSNKEKARQTNIINAQTLQQQKQVQEEERKIKERQAKYDRAIAIANIIEQTAVAAIKVIGQTGIFGIALEPIVLALGAAQLAAVIASPLPKFAVGTDNSPAGLAHVGEKGTELRINPDGRMSLTPATDTVTYLERGTKIVSNEKLMRMLSKPEPIAYAGGQAVDMREVEKLLKENNELQKRKAAPKVNVNVNGNWSAYTQKYFN